MGQENNMNRLIIDVPIELPKSLPPDSVLRKYGDSETDYKIKTWENDEISQMMFGSVPHESLDKRYCEVMKMLLFSQLIIIQNIQ